MNRIDYLCETADRYRLAWQMRRNGATFVAIGRELGVTPTSAMQTVMAAERRMERAAEIYLWEVVDPIVYGVWHEFTHDGRTQVACPRARRGSYPPPPHEGR